MLRGQLLGLGAERDLGKPCRGVARPTAVRLRLRERLAGLRIHLGRVVGDGIKLGLGVDGGRIGGEGAGLAVRNLSLGHGQARKGVAFGVSVAAGLGVLKVRKGGIGREDIGAVESGLRQQLGGGFGLLGRDLQLAMLHGVIEVPAAGDAVEVFGHDGLQARRHALAGRTYRGNLLAGGIGSLVATQDGAQSRDGAADLIRNGCAGRTYDAADERSLSQPLEQARNLALHGRVVAQRHGVVGDLLRGFLRGFLGRRGQVVGQAAAKLALHLAVEGIQVAVEGAKVGRGLRQAGDAAGNQDREPLVLLGYAGGIQLAHGGRGGLSAGGDERSGMLDGGRRSLGERGRADGTEADDGAGGSVTGGGGRDASRCNKAGHGADAGGKRGLEFIVLAHVAAALDESEGVVGVFLQALIPCHAAGDR